jgi:predicted nucleic acid-binding protein
MSGFLLDTNCISELVRIKPDPRVFAWTQSAEEKLLHLSVLSLGEIRKGVTLLSVGPKRIELERWLEIDLPAQFAERLLPINAEIAELWGTMAAEVQLKGIAMPIVDGLIAATAKHHELTIVTRNVKDFRMWGIPVMNPWTSP